MRMSEYFIPTIKETPADAQIISHQLMLKSGMISQSGSGIYTWLPLGLKILKKIENIVREEQNKIGIELLMPTIQPAELWKKSGRFDAFGQEMLKIKDRAQREMLYSPTNEEMITDLFKTYVQSYKMLPKILYQIQWKFRDEIRPRFGVMRGREFLMKDAYSFDLNKEQALITYQKMFVSYLKTFKRMGLKAIPMKADSGAIGGDYSHEFIILSETGESEVYCDPQWLNFDLNNKTDKEIYEEASSLYAATSEKYNHENAPTNLIKTNGIEVGHIFYFGTKYSEIMEAFVTTETGSKIPVEMGSYGIGISRLVGAIIEANHDQEGIIWHPNVAPFTIGVINIGTKDEECIKHAEGLYNWLKGNFEVIYDDRNERPGAKFAVMDLIGIPLQIIISPRNKGKFEIKNRKTNERKIVDTVTLLEICSNIDRM